MHNQAQLLPARPVKIPLCRPAATFTFARKVQQYEAEELIRDEELNAEAAKRYISKSIKRGLASDSGTDLDSILPTMSRLQKKSVYLIRKERIFHKIEAFVEKFEGIGGDIQAS